MNLPYKSRERLIAMGIDLWQRRGARMPHASAAQPRIRLASGSGDWLLVIQGGVPESHRVLMDDVMASIGAARCRFGEWSDSPSAGVAADEWQAHGIEHVLVFAEAEQGRRPGRARLDDPRLVTAPTLAALAESGDARKQLWQQLSMRLGH